MVHSTTLLKLSRQGNVEVISALMNRALQPKGITAKVKFKGDCLKILLEGSRVPSQERLVPYVSQGLTKLGFDLTQEIYVYGRQVGSKAVAWTAEITLPNTHYSQVGVSHPAAISAANHRDDSLAGQLPQPGLFSECLAEEILTEVVYSAISDVLSPYKVNFDIEFEGSDLLITLNNTVSNMDASLTKQIKQALAVVQLDEIKVLRLYQRHPKTQQVMPIQEVVLQTSGDTSVYSPSSVGEISLDFGFDERPLASHQKRSVFSQLDSWRQGLKPLWAGWPGLGVIAIAGLGLWYMLHQLRWLAWLSFPVGLAGIMAGLMVFWRVGAVAIARWRN